MKLHIMSVCVLLSVVINLVTNSSQKYIFKQLKGSLSGNLNFSIFVKRCSGIVLYGVDRKSKILIELEQKDNEKVVIFKHNNLSKNVTVENLCECSKGYDEYLTFVLHLEMLEMKMFCKNATKTIRLNSSLETSNQFNGYPIPREFSNNSKMSYIWMGNIGPYKGLNFMEYYPLRNQLNGCLDRFYLDQNLLQFDNSESLQSNCLNNYIDEICEEKDCKNETVYFPTSDCSWKKLNGRYCKREINEFTDQNNTYEINGKLLTGRLDWMVRDLKTQCLFNVLFENGKFYSLSIDQSNNLIKYSKLDGQKSINNRLVWSKVLANYRYSLIINVTNSQIIIKLSGGDDIKTFIEPCYTQPVSISIGSPSEINCSKFEGLMNFQYELYMKLVTSTEVYRKITFVENKNIKEDFKISFSMITVIAGSVTILFIVFLIIFYIILKKQMASHIRKISTTISMKSPSPYEFINIYERQNDQTYAVISECDTYEEILPPEG